MANDCLVTKLKGVVDNDNLEIFGALVLKKFQDTGNHALTISVSAATTAEIIGDGYFKVSEDSSESAGKTKDLSPNVNTALWLSTGTYKIVIRNKYVITVLGNNWGAIPYKLNLGDLKYISGMTSIYFNHNFELRNSAITGNTSDISNLNLLTTLNLSSKGVYGNIKDFGKLVNLSQLKINLPNVNGEWLDMVASQISKGRDSATIAITWPGDGNKTFNGVVPAAKQEATLSWAKNGNNYDVSISFGADDPDNLSATISVNSDGSYTVVG